MVWDHDTCLAVSTRGVEVAREAGALAVLAVSANVAGAGRGARRRASAARHCWWPRPTAVTDATGTRVAPYGALVLAGPQGREAEASALIDATIEEGRAGGQGTAVQYAHWARAVLLNGLGRYEEAIAAARDGERRHAGAVRVRVGGDRAARSGDAEATKPELAARALERIAEATAVAGTDWALGIRARSRALLSEGEAAERLLPRGDRAAGPHAPAPRARPHAPAVRRVVATREPPGRRARAAPRRPRPARRDRHGGVRRARPPRAAGHGREGAQARRSRRATS